MGEEERQDTSGKHQEEDPQAFENISREEREGQSPTMDEEGTKKTAASGRGPATSTKKPSRSLKRRTSLTERKKRGGMTTLEAEA